MTHIIALTTARIGMTVFNTRNNNRFILNGYINGSQNAGKSGALFRLPSGHIFSDASIVYMKYSDSTTPIILDKTSTDLIFPVLRSGAIYVWGISL